MRKNIVLSMVWIASGHLFFQTYLLSTVLPLSANLWHLLVNVAIALLFSVVLIFVAKGQKVYVSDFVKFAIFFDFLISLLTIIVSWPVMIVFNGAIVLVWLIAFAVCLAIMLPLALALTALSQYFF